MPETSRAPFHVGLTPEGIVDVALELTRASNLFGWSIRDLARHLEVAPSVIYHHVGGKDLLARHVVGRVFAGAGMPPADLAWQDWFRALLGSYYPLVSSHPGVAKWLLMHGPTFPSLVPVVDAGISALQRAGFGDRAGFAYAAVMNNAMLTISVGDERLLHEEDGPRDHTTMMDEFHRAAGDSDGVAVLRETFDPLAQGGDAAARQREEYYTYVVEITIAGLAATLDRS